MYYVMKVDNGECRIHAAEEARKKAERIAADIGEDFMVREWPYYLEWDNFLEMVMEEAQKTPTS